MRIDVNNDDTAVAQRAAALIVQKIDAAVAARGRACLAFSGGRTPWPMLRALAEADVPWRHVHVFQTDERIVPMDDPARTLPQLRDAFLSHVPICARAGAFDAGRRRRAEVGGGTIRERPRADRRHSRRYSISCISVSATMDIPPH